MEQKKAEEKAEKEVIKRKRITRWYRFKAENPELTESNTADYLRFLDRLEETHN